MNYFQLQKHNFSSFFHLVNFFSLLHLKLSFDWGIETNQSNSTCKKKQITNEEENNFPFVIIFGKFDFI